MADIKLTDLPAETSASSTAVTMVVDSNVSKQITVPNLVKSGLPDQTGNTGKVLGTDGSTTSWVAAGGTGTVTSVGVSGGTTGLTVSGSPVTTAGTMTLAGTLGVANGGTGATTLTGIAKGNGTGAMTAATGADIVAAIGSTAVTNASYANSAGDVTGGTTNEILYQNGPNSTHYISPPTLGGQVLSYDGTNILWAAGGGSSLTGRTDAATPFATALGTGAGVALTTGTNNTTVGYNAGLVLANGSQNAFFGALAGDAMTSGGLNTAIGYNALGSTTASNNNTVIGNSALSGANNTTGHNTVIGNSAANVLTGGYNVFIGESAGASASTISQAVVIGWNNLENATTVANGLVAIGYLAGNGITTAANTTLLGSNAGAALTNQIANTMLGYEAGKLATGSLNTFVGTKAGASVTNGGSNTIVGAQATPVLTTGQGNTLIGVGAGNNISTGSNNTVIGNGPLPAADTTAHVALYDGVGDLAVMFNDPGAMTFDGINYGEIGQVLTSQSTTNRPVWSWNNQSNTYVGGGFGVTMTENYSLYLMSPSVATVTMTLPTPSITNRGLTFTVKRTDAVGTNVLNLTTPTGQIDGATTYVIPLRGAITVASTGTNWAILSTYTEPVALQAPIIQSTMGGDGDAFITFTPVEGATGYDVLVDPNGN